MDLIGVYHLWIQLVFPIDGSDWCFPLVKLIGVSHLWIPFGVSHLWIQLVFPIDGSD